MVMNEALEARVVEQLDSISTNLADLDALYHGVLMNYDRALEMYLRDESSTAVLGRLGEVDVPWKRSLVYDSVGLECHSAAPRALSVSEFLTHRLQ